MHQKLGYRPRPLWNEGVHEYLSKAYGAERFSKICEALMRPSRCSSVRVNPLQSSTSEVLAELKSYVSENGPASARCFEHHSLKDVILVQGDGPRDVSYEQEQQQKIVVVSRRCAEAVLRGAEVFVPGVLACTETVDEGDSVAVFARIEVKDSHGNWSNGITRGTTLPLNDWESVLGDRPYDWFIGKGKTLMSRPTLFREAHGVAVTMTDRIYNLPSFNGILSGKMFLQNLPSIVTAMVLDPQPGERILDMCGAPGGKTTAIATLMKNKGEVIALDRTHNKVLDIVKLAKQFDLTCIRAYKLDALKSVEPEVASSTGRLQPVEKEVQSFLAGLREDSTPGDDEETREAKKLKNGPGRGQQKGARAETTTSFPPNSFDRVLLDAPCSALGLRPRLLSADETLEDLGKHASYQRRMFDRAVELVKPGGTLVYSTCTINPGENESLVRYALDKYKFLSLSPQTPRVGGPGLVGGKDVFDGHGHREWLREGEQDLVQRFDPSCESSDTIGFFIAKFVKEAQE